MKNSDFIWKIDIFIRTCCKRNEPTALHFPHGTNSFKTGENVVRMSQRKGGHIVSCCCFAGISYRPSRSILRSGFSLTIEVNSL